MVRAAAAPSPPPPGGRACDAPLRARPIRRRRGGSEGARPPEQGERAAEARLPSRKAPRTKSRPTLDISGISDMSQPNGPGGARKHPDPIPDPGARRTNTQDTLTPYPSGTIRGRRACHHPPPLASRHPETRPQSRRATKPRSPRRGHPWGNFCSRQPNTNVVTGPRPPDIRHHAATRCPGHGFLASQGSSCSCRLGTRR